MNRRRFNETEAEAEERKYLESVKSKIALALADVNEKLDSRHSEMRDLQDYLQDNKADLDHAEKASVRQSVNMMTSIGEHGIARQRRLEKLLDSPYFGRIDINNSHNGEAHPVYIGVHSFRDSNLDEQVVHDWRAPISSMFYEFELGDAYFDAPTGRTHCDLLLKRQYRIEKKQLLFMLESSLNIQDDVLQEELSRASDDKMKNVVATIQRDQNAIIRNDQTHTLIIQGAAGSGKTSIALHRIAFLLYKYRDAIRSDEILIVSPNKVFAHYISQVLPELGEEMIQETTMEVLASELLDHQVEFQTFAEQVSMQLGGRDKKHDERIKFKATPEFLTQLDAYARHIRHANLSPTDIKVGLYTLSARWIAAEFGKYGRLSINEQISRVLAAIADYMKVHHQKQITGKQRTQLRGELRRMFSHTTLKAIYKNFYTWLDQPRMFKQLKGGKYEYCDVFPLIYLKMLLDGTSSMNRIKHLVIDEMQDYTPVQYQVIANLYPCKRTILGDHNQAVSPLSSSHAEAIQEILPDSECMYMHKSYRSTLEITELAQSIQRNPRLVPIERHGTKPTIAACDSEEQELNQIRQAIAAFHDSGYNTFGLICKTQEQANWLYERLDEFGDPIRLLDSRSTVFSAGIIIATAYLAKGLEFDQVMVPFCGDAVYNSVIDRHMLYVACTRAMHELSLTHTEEPSRFLRPAIEGSALVQEVLNS